jgi:uncharacterized coiled-coil DUF342 family protein
MRLAKDDSPLLQLTKDRDHLEQEIVKARQEIDNFREKIDNYLKYIGNGEHRLEEYDKVIEHVRNMEIYKEGDW